MSFAPTPEASNRRTLLTTICWNTLVSIFAMNAALASFGNVGALFVKWFVTGSLVAVNINWLATIVAVSFAGVGFAYVAYKPVFASFSLNAVEVVCYATFAMMAFAIVAAGRPNSLFEFHVVFWRIVPCLISAYVTVILMDWLRNK